MPHACSGLGANPLCASHRVLRGVCLWLRFAKLAVASQLVAETTHDATPVVGYEASNLTGTIGQWHHELGQRPSIDSTHSLVPGPLAMGLNRVS